jgi:hypothetical protein
VPVLDIRNSKSFMLEHLTTSAAASFVVKISGSGSDNITLKDSGVTNEGKKVEIGKEVRAGVVKIE